MPRARVLNGLLPLACTMPNPAYEGGRDDAAADTDESELESSDAPDGSSESPTSEANTTDSDPTDPSTTDSSTTDPSTSESESAGDNCGNGVVDPGEACDDGNTNEDDACTSACTEPFCGDGIPSGNEACDDGNVSSNDACLNDCKFAICGDAFVHAGVEQCDEPGYDTCTPNCEAVYRMVFVTSQPHFIEEIGGLDNADALCNTYAMNAGLPGTYKAWLSDGVASPSTRFTHHQVPYKGTVNQMIPIAPNWNGLVDGGLDAAIVYNELGMSLPEGVECSVGTQVWTGTQPNGTPHVAHCEGFTSTQAVAAVGFAGGTGPQWSICNPMANCAAAARLYCFQQ
jgi:cysteine-rich repeat protein